MDPWYGVCHSKATVENLFLTIIGLCHFANYRIIVVDLNLILSPKKFFKFNRTLGLAYPSMSL